MSFDEIVMNEEQKRERLQKLLRVGVRRFKRVKRNQELLEQNKKSLATVLQEMRNLEVIEDRVEHENVVFRHIKKIGPKKGINGRTLPAILRDQFENEEYVKTLVDFILHHDSLTGPQIDRVEATLKEVDEKKTEASRIFGQHKRRMELTTTTDSLDAAAIDDSTGTANVDNED